MVNDFAWATAKNYVWRATRATIPGKGPIPINMVYEPARASQYANAGPIARHALEFYSKLWAPYPFPQLTLQDGPSNGMEYPMVINSNQGAADHETGHQWWPMMVGTNETWYGWMDEGFNQYMNILSAADSRGVPAESQRPGPELRPDQRRRERSADDVGRQQRRQHVQLPDLLQDAAHALDARRHRRRRRSPARDERVREDLGLQASRRPGTTSSSWTNSSTTTSSWFWYYWLWTTESVDGSIANVSTNGNKTTVTVHQDGQMPSPVVLKVEFAADGPAIKPMVNAKMIDEKTALVTFPVDVWFLGSRTFQAPLDFGGRTIDEDHARSGLPVP